jgi:glycosyltransferase involved in cell wall biosynthesis
MSMKRICMIVYSCYPDDERVRREAEALERMGMAIDVLCLRARGQSAVEHLANITAYRLMDEQRKEKMSHYLWLVLKFTMLAFLRLQRLSFHHRYDLVQAHNMPDFLILTGLLHRLRGIPLVLDLHDLSVELFQSKWNGRSARLQPLVRWAEKWSCALANHLITTSHGFMDRLIKRGIPAEKVTLVINTADQNYFKFQPDREFKPIVHGLKLLYHGTVAERFGLINAIDATALLQRRIPGTTLQIHGRYDPDYREELEQRIRHWNLEQQVQLGDWRSLDQVAEIIRQSHIGLVPYRNEDFMNLALSTKTFEYSACGLPVVAARMTSITSIFNDNAITFCEPDNPEDMANKIYALALDPERRRCQTQQALKALDAISGPVMEKRYVTLIQGLIEKG